MQNLPHFYTVSATGEESGNVVLHSERLPKLTSAPPSEFGGPGDQWSPETLLVAAVADCFILTFRAIARSSKLPWQYLTCNVTGTLDNPNNKMLFTHLKLQVTLTIPESCNEDRARRILEKSEHNCLITNSLTSTIELIITLNKI